VSWISSLRQSSLHYRGLFFLPLINFTILNKLCYCLHCNSNSSCWNSLTGMQKLRTPTKAPFTWAEGLTRTEALGGKHVWHLFATAAITKYHRLGGFNNRSLFHSPWGWYSKIKALAGCFSWGLSSWFDDGFLVFPYRVFSLCTSILVSLPLFPRPQSYWISPAVGLS
jgi:hypothetical protein